MTKNRLLLTTIIAVSATLMMSSSLINQANALPTTYTIDNSANGGDCIHRAME